MSKQVKLITKHEVGGKKQKLGVTETKIIDLSEESEVRICKTKLNKTINTFSDFTHKHSFGANNWKKFLELESHNNSQTISTKVNNNSKKKHQKLPFHPKSKPNDQIVVLDVGSAVDGIKHGKRFKEGHLKNQNLEKTCSSDIKKPILTKQIAIDCEMVGVEIGVNKSMLARVSLVNAHGDCVYDKYVKPTEPVLDYRTRFSGIRPKDLENSTDFKIIQKEVADIINGRILVGHALKNDLKVLFLTHPKHLIRDSSKYSKFREGRTPSLKKLAKKYLGVTIQEGEHSSVQDALAAMQLYRMFRKEWERGFHPKKPKNQKVKTTSSCQSSMEDWAT